MSATPSSARTRDLSPSALSPSEVAPRARRSSMPVAYDIEENAFFDTAVISTRTEDDTPLEQTAEFQARLQGALQQAARRNRFQVRVLYGMTAAACFTAVALGFELQKQKHQTAELTTQAMALSRAPEPREPMLAGRPQPAAPAVAAPVTEPPAAPQPVAVAAPEAEFLAMEAEAQKAKASLEAPAPVQAAIPNVAKAAPSPIAANPVPRVNSVPASVKPTLPTVRPQPAAPQSRTLAAATPPADPEMAGAPANLTREVRPGTASAKPPTRSFPVNR